MSGSSEKEQSRLFLQDESLRKEADEILERSGVGKILRDYNYHPAGSYVMKTMTWRDLDFERYDDDPDCDDHWELGQELRQLDWIWSLHCNNAYEDPRAPGNTGLYWGLRVSDPDGGHIWRVHLWTARKEEFERASPNHDLWISRLNNDTRFAILSLKEALLENPEQLNRVLTWGIYQAVLEEGIYQVNDFKEWWNKKYGKVAV